MVLSSSLYTTHLCAHTNIYKYAPECSGGNGVAIFRTQRASADAGYRNPDVRALGVRVDGAC